MSFRAAGLDEFRTIRQDKVYVLLAGSYTSAESATADARRATQVQRAFVNVVEFPRWCPVRRAHDDFEDCLIWGIRSDYSTIDLKDARRRQGQCSDRHPCEIIKKGPIYLLSYGPYASKDSARAAAIEIGLGVSQVGHLDDICPGREPSEGGYLQCATWSERSFRVPYEASRTRSEVSDPFG